MRVLPVITYAAVVVGSGAAGLAAACLLTEKGVEAALVTEGMNRGTSRNTGSDKQTYYRLSLLDGDSVAQMAAELFACGAADGDVALCEASLSAGCFARLCDMGVPFPRNAYGEYPGYRTDHSERLRASSAGPLTSKYMTERWQARLGRDRVPVLDGYLAVRLVTAGGRVLGLLAVAGDGEALVPIRCGSVVWATGGPAGVYGESVYPPSQHGATGVPLEAGAAAQNLAVWQFGVASVAPIRWNLSGSYQQVLPRYLCGGAEFLGGDAVADTFRKGYEWPFDPAKRSSRVDLAVHRRTALEGRRVYLDFTANPAGYDPGRLPEEARQYLENSGALGATPYERLVRMNPPAARLYADAGLDLSRNPVEIAVCAQHCNGGLSVDADWRTTLPGLYAVGEVAGTHGLRRPGGSALNAGQVGAERAAEAIALRGDAPSPDFDAAAAPHIAWALHFAESARVGRDTVAGLRAGYAARMSRDCGILRDPSAASAVAAELAALRAPLPEDTSVADAAGLPDAFRLHDQLVVSRAVAAAIASVECAPAADRVQTLVLRDGAPVVGGRPPRPIPERDLWFERVWAEYRARIRNG